MSQIHKQTLKIFAPAKINLYLHIQKRRDDGYHNIDSLASFADIGDQLKIERSDEFSLHINGAYASAFTAKERDYSPDSNNLVARAVWALSRAAQKPPSIRIELTKNLPLGSGLGGGSSNAAAALWGLMEWWKISPHASFMPGVMAELGADVPVCLTCEAARMLGTGDILEQAPLMPEIPVLLIYPGASCSTADVFKNFDGPYRESVSLPDEFDSAEDLAAFLKQQHNDLTEIALEVQPAIAQALDTLDHQDKILISRMSGSGSSCFGLFKSEEDCLSAAEEIMQAHPTWWVRAGHINRPERY